MQVGNVASVLGKPFMPHQQLIADVGGEILPNGLPAFRELIVTLMRQQGKTQLVLSHSLERCTLRATAQRVAYTAQNGSDARKKLLHDQVPELERSPLWAAVRNVSRANDNVAVEFKNGSRIDVLASSVSSGHGKIIDLAEIDEAFDDVDDRREQAMLPAMITRPEAQLLVVSTMGTDASTYLNRKVEAGRAAALEGRTSGIAYFEYSIPLDEDVDDPEVWWRYMPGLGYTITEAAIAHTRSTMADGEWRRAFGNQRTKSAERVIPEATWRLVQSTLAPSAPLVFAVEVSPDRDWCAIVAAGHADGRPCVELIDYRPAVSWAVARLAQLCADHGGRVVVDPRSAAGPLLADLRSAGVQVTEVASTDVTQACGVFYDLVADCGLWVRSDPRFDAALNVAVKQPVGDAWRWGRKAGGDVAPLMAATLAVWSARGKSAGDSFAFVL